MKLECFGHSFGDIVLKVRPTEKDPTMALDHLVRKSMYKVVWMSKISPVLFGSYGVFTFVPILTLPERLVSTLVESIVF